jgi:hypothetical protein
MLPAQCYEVFKGQHQLAIVLCCIKISIDYFDIGLPNITDMLAVLYDWQLKKIRNLLPSITSFQLFQFLYHIQCGSYMLTLNGQRLSFPAAAVMSVS